MRIVDQCSHLNGWEYISIQEPQVWAEVEHVISSVVPRVLAVDDQLRSKRSSNLLEDWSGSLKNEFQDQFGLLGWRGPNYASIDRISDNHPYVLKNRIAAQIQFGRRGASPFDLYGDQLALYMGDLIDVGIEMVPMKSMSSDLPLGSTCFEEEVNHVCRRGGVTLRVPLVIIGVAP